MIFKKSHLTTQKINHYGNLLRKKSHPIIWKTSLSQKMHTKMRPAFFSHIASTSHHHHHSPSLTTRVSVTYWSTKWWWCLLSAFFVFLTFLTSRKASCWPNSLTNDQFAELFFLGVKGWCYLRIFVNFLLLLNFRPFLFLPWLFLSCECGDVFLVGDENESFI